MVQLQCHQNGDTMTSQLYIIRFETYSLKTLKSQLLFSSFNSNLYSRLLSLIQSGLTQRTVRRWLGQKHHCSQVKGSNEKMGIEHTKSVFALLVVGVCISIMVLCVEVILRKTQLFLLLKKQKPRMLSLVIDSFSNYY